MTIDITQILLALITLAGAAITTFLIPWLKSKTTETQYNTMRGLVWAAVHAAEVLYKGSGHGEEKKQYVIDWLAERGLHFEESVLIAEIEAAVKELKKQYTL